MAKIKANENKRCGTCRFYKKDSYTGSFVCINPESYTGRDSGRPEREPDDICYKWDRP